MELSMGTCIALILGAVIIAIIVSYVKKVNAGLWALAFSYIITVWILGWKTSDLVALWPFKIVFQLMNIQLFYAYAQRNGAMRVLALNLLYPVRKKPWLIPIVSFFISGLLGMCAGSAASATMPAILFPLMIELGINPILVLVVVSMAALSFGFFPFCQSGTILTGTLRNLGGIYEEQADTIMYKLGFTAIIVCILLFIVAFFVTKAYKAKPVEMDAPPKPNAVQKKTLIVVGVVIALIVIPSVIGAIMGSKSGIYAFSKKIDMQLIAPCGAAVFALLGVENEREMIKAVPWGTIITVSGMSTLMAVATKLGVTNYIGENISTNVAAWLIPVILAALAGFLSMFSGGVTVVTPMLWTLVPSMVAITGQNPLPLLAAVMLGASFTAVSPFSQGGATCLGYCPDEAVREKLYFQQIILAICALVFIIICTLVGITGIFKI